MEEHDISTQRACRVVGLTKSMWYYKAIKDNNIVIDKLNELAEKLPTCGIDTYYGRLEEEGYQWNRKRVLGVYRSMKLTMRRKRKRRLPSRVQEPLLTPNTLNETWSMDFMCDTPENGKRFRIFNVIDDYNREALIIKLQIIFPGEHVVRELDNLIFYRGKPRYVRFDNGPEFMSKVFVEWCSENDIQIKYIEPGRPMQNAFIERFNRLYREDVLDAYLFKDMDQVRSITDEWREDYNENHPHGSLGGISPRKYLKQEIGKNDRNKLEKMSKITTS